MMQRIPGLLKPQQSLLISFASRICVNPFNYENIYKIERRVYNLKRCNKIITSKTPELMLLLTVFSYKISILFSNLIERKL